jgi:hypothetical protein
LVHCSAVNCFGFRLLYQVLVLLVLAEHVPATKAFTANICWQRAGITTDELDLAFEEE